MPVATQASVKALSSGEAQNCGSQILLSNAYHLALRPGVEIVNHLGGLHKFMGWDGPVLTDSGGFQVYSLGRIRKINEEGVEFRSHVDGSKVFVSPEIAIRNQEILGSDIAMAFDQCIGYGANLTDARQAMERTHRWAKRCLAARGNSDQAIFGIVQGGHSTSLRKQSVAATTKLAFEGFAIGGLGVGEGKIEMYNIIELVSPMLPSDKPRYLMGVGSPEDLVKAVSFGIDMFDCALPTRVARNGSLFNDDGRHDITSSRYRLVTGPIDAECDCLTCQNFSIAYLHHLFKCRELLAYRLASLHNLRFYHRLMERIRFAILEDKFDEFRQRFLGSFKPANENARLRQRKAMEARG
jgi:queuine tRNA-ribosyltransferase